MAAAIGVAAAHAARGLTVLAIRGVLAVYPVRTKAGHNHALLQHRPHAAVQLLLHRKGVTAGFPIKMEAGPAGQGVARHAMGHRHVHVLASSAAGLVVQGHLAKAATHVVTPPRRPTIQRRNRTAGQSMKAPNGALPTLSKLFMETRGMVPVLPVNGIRPPLRLAEAIAVLLR